MMILKQQSKTIDKKHFCRRHQLMKYSKPTDCQSKRARKSTAWKILVLDKCLLIWVPVNYDFEMLQIRSITLAKRTTHRKIGSCQINSSNSIFSTKTNTRLKSLHHSLYRSNPTIINMPSHNELVQYDTKRNHYRKGFDQIHSSSVSINSIHKNNSNHFNHLFSNKLKPTKPVQIDHFYPLILSNKIDKPKSAINKCLLSNRSKHKQILTLTNNSDLLAKLEDPSLLSIKKSNKLGLKHSADASGTIDSSSMFDGKINNIGSNDATTSLNYQILLDDNNFYRKSFIFSSKKSTISSLNNNQILADKKIYQNVGEMTTIKIDNENSNYLISNGPRNISDLQMKPISETFISNTFEENFLPNSIANNQSNGKNSSFENLNKTNNQTEIVHNDYLIESHCGLLLNNINDHIEIRENSETKTNKSGYLDSIKVLKKVEFSSTELINQNNYETSHLLNDFDRSKSNQIKLNEPVQSTSSVNDSSNNKNIKKLHRKRAKTSKNSKAAFKELKNSKIDNNKQRVRVVKFKINRNGNKNHLEKKPSRRRSSSKYLSDFRKKISRPLKSVLITSRRNNDDKYENSSMNLRSSKNSSGKELANEETSWPAELEDKFILETENFNSREIRSRIARKRTKSPRIRTNSLENQNSLKTFENKIQTMKSIIEQEEINGKMLNKKKVNQKRLNPRRNLILKEKIQFKMKKRRNNNALLSNTKISVSNSPLAILNDDRVNVNPSMSMGLIVNPSENNSSHEVVVIEKSLNKIKIPVADLKDSQFQPKFDQSFLFITMLNISRAFTFSYFSLPVQHLVYNRDFKRLRDNYELIKKNWPIENKRRKRENKYRFNCEEEFKKSSGQNFRKIESQC